MALRVLCLDIEGGYGGSSRSLFETVRHLPGDVAAEIWCRRQGPIQPRYRDLGVPCRVTPAMPHISSLARFSRNLYVYGRFALRWPRSRGFRRSLADTLSRGDFDVVHLNHEGLFLLGRWLRRRLGPAFPITAHVRTHLPSTVFSRWQYRTLAGAADHLVFISDMEQANVARLAGGGRAGSVVTNIVAVPADVSPAPDLTADRRFKVAAMSNFSWMRGTDRLVDVAAAIRARGRDDVLFVVAGRHELTGNLPGELGTIAGRGGTLVDYAEARGVGPMFRFLGHVADPFPILAASDALMRPSRGNDPWGREVLEAMAFGLPVVTTGTYDRFVEDGVTGVLHADFDADRMADAILRLADDPAAARRMGAAARARVADLCDGPSRAADLADIWRGLVARQPS